MTKLRTALTIGVVVVGAIGAVAGFVLVDRVSTEAARSLLAVDAGMLLALAITVWVLLGPTSTRIDELVEALRALARGDKHTRVNPDDFAGLAEIARAANEVGASLCENDDPNLGPVQKRTRDHVIEQPRPRRSASETRPKQPPSPSTLPPPTRGPSTSDGADDADGEIGVVRARPRTLGGVSEARSEGGVRPMIDGESVSEPRPARRSAAPASAAPTSPVPVVDASLPSGAGSREPASSEAVSGSPDVASDAPASSERAPASFEAASGTAAAPAAASPDDALAEAVASPEPGSGHPAGGERAAASEPHEPGTSAMVAMAEAPTSTNASAEGSSADASAAGGNDTTIEPAPMPSLPTREELEALFAEFQQAKKVSTSDSALDVDFEAFADTIRGECERLVAEHACSGVRFEVAVAEGEVSLRPRLLR